MLGLPQYLGSCKLDCKDWTAHIHEVGKGSSHEFSLCSLLPKKHFRWKLEYVDLSGCSLITDTALQRLAQSLSSSPHLTPPPCSFLASSQSCGRGNAGEGGGGGGGEEKGGEESQLKCLILSGCYSVTDVGLRYIYIKFYVDHDSVE